MSYLLSIQDQRRYELEETHKAPEPRYPGLERARTHSELHSTRRAIEDGENAVSFGYFATGIVATFYLLPSAFSTALPMLYPELSPDPNLHIGVAGILTALGIGLVGRGITSIAQGYRDVREHTTKEQTLVERLEKTNSPEHDRIPNYTYQFK